jgi:hypothetical protein
LWKITDISAKSFLDTRLKCFLAGSCRLDKAVCCQAVPGSCCDGIADPWKLDSSIVRGVTRPAWVKPVVARATQSYQPEASHNEVSTRLNTTRETRECQKIIFRNSTVPPADGASNTRSHRCQLLELSSRDGCLQATRGHVASANHRRRRSTDIHQ